MSKVKNTETEEHFSSIYEDAQGEKRRQKFQTGFGWIWFIISTIIYLVILGWVLSKVDNREVGIVILLLFIITRENRMRSIASYNLSQNHGLILATICSKLGITEFDEDTQKSREEINKGMNRSLIQIYIEYALLGLILLVYLLNTSTGYY
jgi:hypothetical protein